MAVESVNYDCPVLGYHVHETVWEPKGRQYDVCKYNTICLQHNTIC